MGCVALSCVFILLQYLGQVVKKSVVFAATPHDGLSEIHMSAPLCFALVIVIACHGRVRGAVVVVVTAFGSGIRHNIRCRRQDHVQDIGVAPVGANGRQEQLLAMDRRTCPTTAVSCDYLQGCDTR